MSFVIAESDHRIWDHVVINKIQLYSMVVVQLQVNTKSLAYITGLHELINMASIFIVHFFHRKLRTDLIKLSGWYW